MGNQTVNNKRIVKNTFLLYARHLITMDGHKIYTYYIDDCRFFALRILPRTGRNDAFCNFSFISDLYGVQSDDILLKGNLSRYYKANTNLDTMLSDLKNICQDNDIDTSKVCIVGSSVLTLFGLRDNSDIDFIVASDIRKRFGIKLHKFNDKIEMVAEGWARSLSRQTICNDDLIKNPAYHYIYKGFKFVSLSLLYERKLAQKRTKDIDDIIDIEFLKSTIVT